MTINGVHNPKQDGNFWRSRRVVVTGGAGFLGSRVVAQLRERGATNVVVPRSAELDLRVRENSRLEREAALVPAFAH